MIFKKLLTSSKIILIATITLCTVVLGNDTTENDKMANAAVASYQLSYFLKPLHYDAKIKFNYKTNDIIGQCNIVIHVDRQIENMSIDPGTFAIFKIVLYNNTSYGVRRNEKIHIARYSFFHYLNVFVINFTNTSKFLPPGQYNLMIAYMRHINNNKKHFINSLYSNQERDNILKAVDFDKMTARQLFPTVCSTILCRNETNINVTFKISIKHHKNYTVYSNIPIQTTENDEHDMIWTHFNRSSIMLFNRLKLIITTFSNIPTMTADVTFWGRENAICYLQLAECIAQQILYYLKHENNKIKISKLDYVALWNSQHNNSETEGWIIHREHNIIHDELIDTVSHKVQVSYLISYQIVSHWYIDTLIWSKKAFLTLLATYILQKIPPNRNIMNAFIVETQRESFLYSTPSNLKKVNLLSYPLNYTKSLNIWRMLHQIIPDNVFWIGIRTYIDQEYSHMHTHAENTNDLWNIMRTVLYRHPDNSTAFIVRRLISTWIAERHYYPVVYVTQNLHTKSITFSYLTPDNIDEDIQYHPIFITYTTKSIMNFQEIFNNKSFWLSPHNRTEQYEESDVHDWIIVNLKQTGYYRVLYEPFNWLKLATYMNSTEYINIHVLNRAQIIDDAFHSLIHGELNDTVFWKVSAFLSQDTSYVAWYPMLKIFEYITVKVPFKDNAINIKVYMKQILDKVLKELRYNKKWPKDDLFECLREEILKWACILNNEECLTEANTQMKEDLDRFENNTLITQMSRQWTYCTGMKIVNVHTWRKFWLKWISTYDHKLLKYIPCLEHPSRISEYLQNIATEPAIFTKIQPNTTRAHLILLIIAKHVNHDIVCDSVLENLNTYILSFSSNKKTLKIAILIVIISHQHDVWQLDKVLKFAKTDLKEIRLVDAVYKKIKKRKSVYRMQVKNYGIGLNMFP